MDHYGHFIGGKNVKSTSGREADVFQPLDGTVRAKVALGSKAELDAAVGGWIAARTADEVSAAFAAEQAAVAPVYDVRGIFADPQYAALGTIARVPDEELGTIAMQNVFPRLSATPGAIRWTGRPHGADTDAVLGRLGYTAAEIAELRAAGAV